MDSPEALGLPLIFALLYQYSRWGGLNRWVPAAPAIAAFAPDSVAVAIKLSSLDLHPAEYCIRRGWRQPTNVPLLHDFLKACKGYVFFGLLPNFNPKLCHPKRKPAFWPHIQSLRFNCYLVISKVMFLYFKIH